MSILSVIKALEAKGFKRLDSEPSFDEMTEVMEMLVDQRVIVSICHSVEDSKEAFYVYVFQADSARILSEVQCEDLSKRTLHAVFEADADSPEIEELINPFS